MAKFSFYNLKLVNSKLQDLNFFIATWDATAIKYAKCYSFVLAKRVVRKSL